MEKLKEQDARALATIDLVTQPTTKPTRMMYADVEASLIYLASRLQKLKELEDAQQQEPKQFQQ